jgi:hypothetical protein
MESYKFEKSYPHQNSNSLFEESDATSQITPISDFE